MSVSNPDRLVTKQDLADFYTRIFPYLKPPKPVKHILYGFQIDGSKSDPDQMVTYLSDCDNYEYTPAHMDFTNGVFDYGDWKTDEFFMPKPCMLKSDGTVDYYLNPSDYSKKSDGTASDIENTSYDGNAMMEWGRDGDKIWYKIEPYGTNNNSAKIYIANYQADEDFHDWNFHNSHSVSVDHFYTPIYNGSLDSNNKLRSLSNQQISTGQQATSEMIYATANNPSGSDEMWNIECWADRLLITSLLVLMCKSTNSQAKFGMGASSNGGQSVNTYFRTGVHNNKGLFYGTNSGSVSNNDFSNCVKVFGMENYYGFALRRINGIYVAGGGYEYVVKLTYGQEDGSTGNGYSYSDVSYYYNTHISAPYLNGSYFSNMGYSEYGMFPTTGGSGASSTTYYTDGIYGRSGTPVTFGGHDTLGDMVGVFSHDASTPQNHGQWFNNASICCKPLQ